MLIFGAWGKTGINCFVFITGYFMCRSQITISKFIKLYIQITFYSLIIYGIFCFSGHEPLSIIKILKRFWPIFGINVGFTSCFLIFYLLIPFLTILVNNLNKRQHLWLLAILLFSYSVLPYLPFILVSYNYVTWFCIVFLLSSYTRIYNIEHICTHRQWGFISLGLVLIGLLSIIFIKYLHSLGYVQGIYTSYFISDSNKLLSIAIALCSFMYFKGITFRYSKIINLIGASTFGVLLIHANSDAMRQWLWRETVDCVGHFGESVLSTLSYAITSVLVIFIVCSSVDILVCKYIVPHLTNGIILVLSKFKNRIFS